MNYLQCSMKSYEEITICGPKFNNRKRAADHKVKIVKSLISINDGFCLYLLDNACYTKTVCLKIAFTTHSKSVLCMLEPNMLLGVCKFIYFPTLCLRAAEALTRQ